MPDSEFARSQSQICTSSTPPLISLPMQMPWPQSLRQSNTRICAQGRLISLPSGFLPLLMATASSPVENSDANSAQFVEESGSQPSPFQTPSDTKVQWSVWMSSQ